MAAPGDGRPGRCLQSARYRPAVRREHQRNILRPVEGPFELDLWGRLRRATEAARANLLNAEENRKAVVSTLVSEVATDYPQLRELDYELEMSRRTLGYRGEFLRLTQQRQSGGVATLIDLRQAERLVETAAASIPTIQQQIEQTENLISLLLGQNPGSVGRGRRLLDQELTPEVPVGLPSALLERAPISARPSRR